MKENLICQFFSLYEQRINEALMNPPKIDIDATVGAFAEVFIESSPAGVITGKNDEEFRQMIPKGHEFYRSIGTTSMKISSLDVTRLDEFHWMSRVHWDSRYMKESVETRIEFDVIYFLRMQDLEPKIFAYITGDEQKVLKDHGLLEHS
jgi:hypothetical protein